MTDEQWKTYLQQWQIPASDTQLVNKIISRLPYKCKSHFWENAYLRFAAIALFLAIHFYLGFWLGIDNPDLLTLALLE
jgi:hypothetical protein